MTIQEYQHSVDAWIQNIGIRYYDELTNMAILTEEVGEVARLMSRIYGEQSFKVDTSEAEAKEKLGDEIADVFFVLTCIANQTGIDLPSIIAKNMTKKTDRDRERHLSNNG